MKNAKGAFFLGAASTNGLRLEAEAANGRGLGGGAGWVIEWGFYSERKETWGWKLLASW